MVEFLRNLLSIKDALNTPQPMIQAAMSAAMAAQPAASAAIAPEPVTPEKVAAPASSEPAPTPPTATGAAFIASDYAECTDRRFFEIMETYQNRARALHNHVTWDKDEEARLRERRIAAYQQRNGTPYKPHDVFHLWPYHRIDPEHVIKEVMLKADAPRLLPEFSSIMNVNVVSERVMQAIASLENRHAFYPLQIIEPETGLSHRYHFLQFLEHLDCTVPKLGGFRKGVRQDNSTYWVRTSKDDKVWLDIGRVGTRHLFYDKRGKSGCFISAEVADKLGSFLPRGYYLVETGLVRSVG